MKKFINYLIIFWISFFILILFMGMTRHVFLNGHKITGVPKQIILFLSGMVGNIGNYSGLSKPMVVESPSTLTNGFNHTRELTTSKDYLLVSSYNDTIGQAIVKLVRISDGKILHKWFPDIDMLNKSLNALYINGIEIRLHKKITPLVHPYLLNDGSLVFLVGGLFKIDKNSNIVWYNPTSFHHSIETDSDGNFWICGINSSKKNSEKYQIIDDVIKKVSAIDGKILFEKSVFEILMENGYNKGYFFIYSQVTYGIANLDYIHLNDVQPVLEDSKSWAKGDLFLSLRNQNLILLYRPSTNKIIWQQNGPWLKQHDITVIDSTRIGIFGNNVIDAQFANEKSRLIDGYNRQYIYDFSQNKWTTPYDNFFKSANIGTYSQGRSRILRDGNIFIEETDQGRILYGNYNEEIWSYVERIDDKRISLFFWSRYITEEEFKKFTFLNENNN